jgi:hypothetical protein
MQFEHADHRLAGKTAGYWLVALGLMAKTFAVGFPTSWPQPRLRSVGLRCAIYQMMRGADAQCVQRLPTRPAEERLYPDGHATASDGL